MAATILRSSELEATILDDRQLVSLKHGDHEFMHRGGDPACTSDRAVWPHSEFLMGPIVGPPKDGVIEHAGERYSLDRHGFLRHATYRKLYANGYSAGFDFAYEGGTPFPSTTSDASFRFPHSFSIERHYSLLGRSLLLEFSLTNDSEVPMAFEIGWHPGFNAPDRQGSAYDVEVAGERLRFDQIAHNGGEVRKYNASEARFYSADRLVTVASNLPNLMVWRKANSSILGIEPVSDLPENEVHFRRGALYEPHCIYEFWVRLDL